MTKTYCLSIHFYMVYDLVQMYAQRMVVFSGHSPYTETASFQPRASVPMSPKHSVCDSMEVPIEALVDRKQLEKSIPIILHLIPCLR